MRVQDFDFKPSISEETIERATKWLKNNYENFSVRANYCVFSGDKKEEHIGEACHSRMNMLALKNRDCIANENGTIRRWGKTEVPPGVSEFTHWFLYDSMFGRFILNKDDVAYGFVISADIPCPLLQNMNIICRHFWEAGEFSFAAFKEMLDAGYSGDVAYGFCFNTNLSHCHNTSPGATPYDPKDQIYGYAAHRAWSLWYSLKSFQSFLKGEFGEAFATDTQPSRHFRNYSTILGGAQYCGNYYSALDVISELITNNSLCKERLIAHRKGKESFLKITNPFSKPAAKPATVATKVNYQELMEVILPYMKEAGLLNV